MREPLQRTSRVPWSSAVASSALIALAACHNDASELYSDSPNVPDSGTRTPRDSGAPPAPMRTPYEAALAIYGEEPACLACVEASCEKEASTCAENESCLEDARCRVDCDGNQYCEWDCKLAQPKADRPTFPLEDCIVKSCVQACRVGQDFDCVGKHSPPLLDPDEEIVQTWRPTLGLPPGPFPEGIRARVCSLNDPTLECAEPASETLSDAEGVLRIEWPKPSSNFGTIVPFEGYLELTDPEDPPRIVPTLLVGNRAGESNPPEWPFETGVLAPEDIALIEAQLGITYDPSAGFVVGVTYDCRVSERRRGVCVSAEVSPPQPETRFFYGLEPTATCTSDDPMLGFMSAHPVPPGFVTWVVSRDGQEVTRLGRIPVRAGALTTVILLPE